MINFLKKFFGKVKKIGYSKEWREAYNIAKEIEEFEDEVNLINKEHQLQQKNPFNMSGKQPLKYINYISKNLTYKARKKAYRKFSANMKIKLINIKSVMGVKTGAAPFQNKVSIVASGLYNDRISQLYEKQVNSAETQGAVISELDFFTRKLKQRARELSISVEDMVREFNKARHRRIKESDSPYDLPFDLELKDIK